nr:hypothetical protein [Candidatus Njordarchaeota archaeon]
MNSETFFDESFEEGATTRVKTDHGCMGQLNAAKILLRLSTLIDIGRYALAYLLLCGACARYWTVYVIIAEFTPEFLNGARAWEDLYVRKTLYV